VREVGEVGDAVHQRQPDAAENDDTAEDQPVSQISEDGHRSISAFDEVDTFVRVVLDLQDLKETDRVPVLVEVDGTADPLVIDVVGTAAVCEDLAGGLEGGRFPFGAGDTPDGLLKRRAGELVGGLDRERGVDRAVVRVRGPRGRLPAVLFLESPTRTTGSSLSSIGAEGTTIFMPSILPSGVFSRTLSPETESAP